MSESGRQRRVNSAQNELVKELRRAFNRAELSSEGYCAIESVRTLEEAIRSGLQFKALFFAESVRERAERLLPQISKHTEVLELPDKVFESAVATGSPQGVAALVKIRERKLQDVLQENTSQKLIPLALIAVGVQDPGNLGTMIRSSEAFSATVLIAAEGTVSPYNAKVVRASAGSLFRLPVIRMALGQAISELREREIKIIATAVRNGEPLDSATLSRPVAILMGSEGGGLPRNVLRSADQVVTIPYAQSVESLNAGIAASIVLYEAARQRAASDVQKSS